MGSRIERRKILKGLGYGLLGSGAALVASYGYGTRVETEWLQLEKITIPIKDLPSSLEGFRIVLLCDFHLYPHTQLPLIARAASWANQLEPDLIALGGDYVQGTADAIFDLAPVLGGLNARYGVFAILGNHDHWRGAQTVVQGLTEHRIPVLSNAGLTLEIGRSPLFLAGVDDGWVRRHDLQQALEKCPGGVTSIVLMHEPDFADSFCRDDRITLQLSGHSHGGQARFPGIGSPFLPPYGRKYDLGLYRVQDMWLYTNRGIGVTVPIRLNCPPEVTEITLAGAEDVTDTKNSDTGLCSPKKV